MDRSVAYQKGVSTVENRAYGYTVDEDGVHFSDQSPTSAVLGDGGVYSSVEDLLKWDRALSSGDLIRADLLQQAWTPGLADYGFGWRIDRYRDRRRIHHSGGTSGFKNFFQRFPDDDLSVVVLTNRAEPNVQPLAEQVADLFLE
jgi:CubicO group peptidase (beta-lactamase class C family)